MTNTAIDQLKWKPQPARKHIKQKLKYHEWNTYNILILLISIYIYILLIYKLPVSLAPVVPTIKCAEYLRDGPLVHFSVSVKTRNNGETLKMFPLSRISLISHIKWFHLLQRSNGSIDCKDQMVPVIATRSTGSSYCNKIKWFHLLQ